MLTMSAPVGAKASPICLWSAEVVQFAQPVEYAISRDPFSKGQMLGLVMHGECQALGPPLTCSPQELLSSSGVFTADHGPRGLFA